jgi:hypothetical protein
MVFAVGIGAFLIIAFCYAMQDRTGDQLAGQKILAAALLIIVGAIVLVVGVPVVLGAAVVAVPIILAGIIIYFITRFVSRSRAQTPK